MQKANGLKPQDVLVLLKLLLWSDVKDWSFASIAAQLSMSASEVHAAIKRAEKSGLYDPLTKRPKRNALREFIVFGLPYVFPGNLIPGKKCKGIPTAHSAPPLDKELISTADDQIVWPFRSGKMEGTALQPLYSSVPKAANKDPKLYELLTLIDALRSGRTRDRELAKAHLEKRLG